MASAIGASTTLPYAGAKAGLLNPNPTFNLDNGDYCSCPDAAIRALSLHDRPRWIPVLHCRIRYGEGRWKPAIVGGLRRSRGVLLRCGVRTQT
jgi:hypothetical protein